jgi:hypothetical protein
MPHVAVKWTRIGTNPLMPWPGALWSVAGPSVAGRSRRRTVSGMRVRAAAAVLCAGAALASAPSAAAADGGSGTYVATGQTYYFDLVNTGTMAWQFFTLVGPPGVTFVGGANSAEAQARCVLGQPDGLPNEIECGPLSPSLVPVQAHMGFVVTVNAAADCDAPFELSVSSTGALPFTRAPDVTESGSCTAAAPSARTQPVLHGTPTVGRTVTATPPTWSAAPTRVTYRWQRCTATACTTIANATRLTLRLTRSDAAHSVRLVATATIDGVAVVSRSAKLAVRTR